MAMPAFFNRIVAAPAWQKILLGLMGLAVVVVGGYFLLVSPLETTVGALRSQHASLQAELVQTRAAAEDVARTRREAVELERRIGVLRERLPAEKDMPPLFRTLTDAAYQAGLTLSLFQPREGKTRDYYVEIPITMTSEGGYHQLGDFFERVAGLPRVVTVQELKVTGLAKSKNAVRAELTLATYTYRPVGSPPVPKPEQPGAARPGAARPGAAK